MANLAQAERRVLCDELEQVGPDAATLIDEWSARDLAAHLVLRDRRLDAAVGILAPPLARYTERVQTKIATRPFPELVETIRSGPPRYNPLSLGPLDAAANTVEFFVHTEDIRRAQPGWSPRPLDGELESALWSSLRRQGRVLGRRSTVPIEATTPDGRRTTLKKGDAPVTVSGPSGELLLFAMGRQPAARVEVIGPEDRVAAARSARLGL